MLQVDLKVTSKEGLSTIGRMTILRDMTDLDGANVPDIGNYSVVLMELSTGKECSGRVTQFDRSFGAWALVARALNAIDLSQLY